MPNLPGKEVSTIESKIFDELDSVKSPKELPHHHIFSTIHSPSLLSSLNFELKTFIGRTFLSRRPKRKGEGPQLLHFGCGFRLFDEFVNADMFQYRFWKRAYDWMLDIRYPLKCDDNYWDGIFTEHVLEHMHHVHVLQFLREAYRTLKPGCHIRIIVPDINIYIKWYLGGEPHPRIAERWDSGIIGLNTISHKWLHLSTWDPEFMARFMKSVGFKDIRQCTLGVGRDPKLLKDNEYNDYESLYLEATK